MTEQKPREQIIEEVTSWPRVEAGPGRRGEFAFRVGSREIGHLHGGHAAHFAFSEQLWRELREQGRLGRTRCFQAEKASGPAPSGSTASLPR